MYTLMSHTCHAYMHTAVDPLHVHTHVMHTAVDPLHVHTHVHAGFQLEICPRGGNWRNPDIEGGRGMMVTDVTTFINVIWG